MGAEHSLEKRGALLLLRASRQDSRPSRGLKLGKTNTNLA